MTKDNFSNYTYTNGVVIRIKDGKSIPIYKCKSGDRIKLKHDTRGFILVSSTTIRFIFGDTIKLPDCATPIPDTDNKYFIDSFGNVYSFNLYKSGILLKPSMASNGYLRVSITIGGKRFPREIHNLMCNTFIRYNYAKDGLVCLHIDNNKCNNHISNLKVGTYSENNKQAYTDGLNPGNGLKLIPQVTNAQIAH